MDWFKTERRDSGDAQFMRIESRDDAPVDNGSIVMSGEGPRTFEEQLAFHLNAKGITTDDISVNVYPQGFTRNRASAYIALNRCVQILSGICADLLCGGGLRIVDRDGDKVDDDYARAVLDLFTGSHDGGETPTRTLVEDAMADYALDGNALIMPRMVRGRLTGLTRYQSWDASRVQDRKGGPRQYLAQEAESEFGGYDEIDARDMVHFRFPLMDRQGNTNSTRLGFAKAPITDMREALKIGMDGDKYIRQWFGRGAKSGYM